MKEIIVRENEAGQRMDKLLSKYLKEAPKSFIYKMLRKKNITLDGKKASGNEILKTGNSIRFYLSDETYEKFAGPQDSAKQLLPSGVKPLKAAEILYEDEHIILMNKPAGWLSQKAEPKDVSMNERMLAYLVGSGKITEAELSTFHPSVCNRLDRNTSGILIGGKSLAGLQEMSRMLKDRSLHKYYQCIVKGKITEAQRISGYLSKDETTNKVRVTKEPGKDAKKIVTEYRPLAYCKEGTLLEILLVTGRTHQIRAHLASIGHPILGDPKYGDAKTNQRILQNHRIRHQTLHAARVELPVIDGKLGYLSGKCFEAPLPETFARITSEK
ncbi:MAG: RluA family pseudouridine synthase [Eubacteriales bacterium]|nr:RluA family pseudouridine synthase [Eubacteriales bacterium]